MSRGKYATVDDLIIILQKLSEEGLGDAEVWCNSEYPLSNKIYEECSITKYLDKEDDRWISFD